VELEWAGIPAVHLCHEGLSGAARGMAVASGMPDYTWLTVAHPHDLGGVWTDDEARQLAKELAPQVLAALTRDRE
jgi:hypothetical protein